jgi:hypothetical protein
MSGPECGVLPDLVPFLRLFHKRRGLDDIENAAAWTLHHLIDCHVTKQMQLREVSQCARDYLPEDGKDFAGFGVCQEFHGDIRFFYAVHGPVLKVFEAHWPMQDAEPKEKHFRLLQNVRLDGNENEEV